MRDEQVVPAVAKDHDRRFAVDRDVDWLPLGIEPFAGLRIQLDESDVAEVRAVGEPERSVGGIAKHARVDGVAVLDAIGPDDRAAVLPFVVRRGRIQCLADEQSDCRLGLRAGCRIVEEVFVADDRIRSGRPGVVAAARDDVRARAVHRASACINVPARRHVHPSSDIEIGRPLPVA